jgi:hypothetical protein
MRETGIVIEAVDGKVKIYGHGEIWLTPVEAFNLASQLIETAKRAKEQGKRDS